MHGVPNSLQRISVSVSGEHLDLVREIGDDGSKMHEVRTVL